MKIERLREWREARGLKQRDLAAEAGTSPFTVLRAESGEGVRPNTAKKLADALGIPVSDLLARPPVSAGGPHSGKEKPSPAERATEGVRDEYWPIAHGVHTYCDRWQARIAEASREQVEEYVLVCANFGPAVLAAVAHEAIDLAVSLERAGVPFSSDDLRAHSVVRPALERWGDLGKKLVETVPLDDDLHRSLVDELDELQASPSLA